MPESPQAVAQISEWLRSAKRAVVFTGAGMSTESGLPDFRSASGLWKQNRRFEELASIEALLHDYPSFVEFYRWRLEMLAAFKPNRGHQTVAAWQRRGQLRKVITQNVDGYHQAAGSEDVLCLHGTLQQIRCRRCGRRAKLESFSQGASPACGECGDRLRPGVVLFGEALDATVLNAAVEASQNSDFFLVLGSSLSVSPANSLPIIAKQAGARVAIINREATPLQRLADLEVHAAIGDTLESIERELLRAAGFPNASLAGNTGADGQPG